MKHAGAVISGSNEVPDASIWRRDTQLVQILDLQGVPAPRFRAALAKEPECQLADRPVRPAATARQRDAPSGAKVFCIGSPRAAAGDRLFDSLSERLGGILDRLTRRGALSEADVDAAMREVRRALLEADVALDVVRSFIDQVKKHAVGVDGHQVGHARPDGRQDRARPADRDARRRTPIRSTSMRRRRSPS